VDDARVLKWAFFLVALGTLLEEEHEVEVAHSSLTYLSMMHWQVMIQKKVGPIRVDD
jgi:hypothetical protein